MFSRWKNRGRGDARFAFRFSIGALGPLPPAAAGHAVCVRWVRGSAKRGETKKHVPTTAFFFFFFFFFSHIFCVFGKPEFWKRASVEGGGM
jgi:hypothetical protein